MLKKVKYVVILAMIGCVTLIGTGCTGEKVRETTVTGSGCIIREYYVEYEK